MTQQEFVDRVIGLRWRRWGSDFEGADCFGLLLMYFREVRGLDLGSVPHVDLVDGFAAIAAQWPRCEPQPGACAFMAWQDGAPSHCGVLLAADRVLHCPGAPDYPGSARITPLAAMRRLYGGEITFHRYQPC